MRVARASGLVTGAPGRWRGCGQHEVPRRGAGLGEGPAAADKEEAQPRHARHPSARKASTAARNAAGLVDPREVPRAGHDRRLRRREAAPRPRPPTRRRSAASRSAADDEHRGGRRGPAPRAAPARRRPRRRRRSPSSAACCIWRSADAACAWVALVPAAVEERPGRRDSACCCAGGASASAACGLGRLGVPGLAGARCADRRRRRPRVPPCSRSVGVTSTSERTRSGCGRRVGLRDEAARGVAEQVEPVLARGARAGPRRRRRAGRSAGVAGSAGHLAAAGGARVQQHQGAARRQPAEVLEVGARRGPGRRAGRPAAARCRPRS